MPQWSDIVSEITSGAGHVGSSIVTEAKNIGGSAASQVTGSAFKQSSTTTSSTNNSMTNTHSANEVKNLGKSFTSQIFGSNPLEKTSEEELSKMKKDDAEFSEDKSAEVKARITRIYEDYERQRKRREEARKQQEEKREEEKKEFVQNQKKRELQQENPAITKTRAENKNFGAE